MKKGERFLLVAMGIATQSKCRMRHGALVVKHGHILGASPNLFKNSPKFVAPQHSSIHAEVAALKKAGWPLRATVYVARINNFGEARLSKPCAKCQIVLDEVRAKVIWTTSEKLVV